MDKPIILWTIDEIRKTKIFDRIIVSTDDKDIINLCNQHGVEVPFKRPQNLSDDFTGTIDVIAHSCDWLLQNNIPAKFVCCLYPASPFTFYKDIIMGYQKVKLDKWSYAFPVTEFEAPIFRSFLIDEKDKLQMLYPEHFTSRSQDLPKVFHDAGQFYWGKLDAWLEKKQLFGSHSFPIKIPRWRVQDIDTEDDWQRALNLKNIILDKDNWK